MSITYVPPEQEVPRRSWVRRHPVRTAVAGAVVLAVAGSAAGAVASQGGSPVSPVTMASWRAGPGGHALLAVQADLTQVADDSGPGADLGVLGSDGAQLAADAGAAAGAPLPPSHPSDYAMAMADFAEAGQALVSGDIAGASIDLQAGTARLQFVR